MSMLNREPVALRRQAPTTRRGVPRDFALATLIDQVRPAILDRLRAKGLVAEELEDLGSETIQRLLEAVHHTRAPGAEPVRDLLAYGLSVADCVFSDHIRRVRPNWCRLKRRLLDILDGRAGGSFARWRIRQNWLGGLACWRGQPFRATPIYLEICDDFRPFCRRSLGNQDPSELSLPDLLAIFFKEVRTPVEVDELTNRIAALRQVADRPAVPLEALVVEGRGRAGEGPFVVEGLEVRLVEELHAESMRAQLWQRVTELPIRQRAALLLDMTRDEILLLASTISQAAAVVELSVEEFARLWARLPMTDSAIAERLGATPKQVSNLRKCARERIGRWLNRWARCEPDGSARAARPS